MGLVGDTMADIELEFLNIQKDRGGQLRYPYFRRDGRRWPLPGGWPQNPPSEEFMGGIPALARRDRAGRIGHGLLPIVATICTARSAVSLATSWNRGSLRKMWSAHPKQSIAG